VLTTLGPALMATKGLASAEAGHTYARARALCQQVEATPQLAQVFYGLWLFYLARAELQTARELGEQLLGLAQRAHDSAPFLEAHYALGATLTYLGELTAARAHLEQGITLYDRQQHRTHTLLYGRDNGISCCAFAAINLWLLGYPDQALQRSHEALTLAQEVAHPFSLAFALCYAAYLHGWRREGHLVQARAESVITLTAEQGFVQWWMAGTVLQGWARATHGQGEEGIAQIRQGLEAWQATGAAIGWSYLLGLLADVYARMAHGERRAGRARRGTGIHR
jgi:predicted ATPase